MEAWKRSTASVVTVDLLKSPPTYPSEHESGMSPLPWWLLGLPTFNSDIFRHFLTFSDICVSRLWRPQ